MPIPHDADAVMTERGPIEVRVGRVPLADLTLGYHGKTCDFVWRPYDQRRDEAKADYDRLIVSVFHHGVKCPVIAFDDNVLIGMRRVEIARRMGIAEIVVAQIVNEDVARWDDADIDVRLAELKDRVGTFDY